MSSELLYTEKSRKCALYPIDHSSPKAEVAGSNPVGCASVFMVLPNKMFLCLLISNHIVSTLEGSEIVPAGAECSLVFALSICACRASFRNEASGRVEHPLKVAGHQIGILFSGA
jgi:hypothetical protein